MSKKVTSVLIIDDDAQDRLLIARQLSKTIDDVRLFYAEHLQEGLQTVKEQRIDVVLLDLTLVETDGLQTLRSFRSRAPDVPVVVLTGMTDDSFAMEAIETGAQDFIRKNEIDNPWLNRCIQNALQRHELQQKLKNQALCDPLTCLPNRTAFESSLESTFKNYHDQKEENFTVVFIDIDEFKLINDCYGHAEGDRVLVEFAERLQSCIRSSDVLARFGGDEFVALLKGTKMDEDIQWFVDRLNSTLASPMNIKGNRIFLAASVGYVSYCESYADVKHMLRDADTAMCEAKKSGKRTYLRFAQVMREQALEMVGLDAQIQQALANEEFEVYYQPIVDLETERTLKFEALIRWNHPTQGLVFPSKFIDRAERTGLIVPLGQWILKSVCEQIAAWDIQFPDEAMHVCVNVSPNQLQDSHFVDSVLETLRNTGLSGDRITLEITEGTIMQNPEQSIQLLQRLREVGIRISIDDFGTGHSSLAKLHQFQLDTLKIDRSFVQELLREGYADLLVKTILFLASSIGLEVIAEGIETSAEAERLQEMGCVLGQGFLYGKPMPASKATEIIEGLAYAECRT